MKARVLATATAVLAAAASFGAAPKPDTAAGLAAFETVRRVFQHPRCQNCHIPGDAPLQFDDGRPHGQNVLRGANGHGVRGLPCSTCHGGRNLPASYGASVPPGAPNWSLPPAGREMVFIGLSPRALCTAIKDPRATGGRALPAMLEHLEEDGLVAWGWDPGPGRTPVPIPRADLVAAFKTWMDAGAPCP